MLTIVLSVSAMYAQVGVNTENPKGLLHIDGGSAPATTNPPTGAVNATQATDDVIVTDEGNLGIGILSPSAKVDINSNTIGEGLRIKDNNQKQNKVLISDVDGVGTWSSVGSSWFAALTQMDQTTFTTFGTSKVTGFNTSTISNPDQGSVNATTGDIVVPFTGYYKITISLWSGSNWTTVPIGNPCRSKVMLYLNNTPQGWTPYIYGTSRSYGVSPTYIQMVYLNARDTLSVYIDHSSLYLISIFNYMVFSVEYY